MSSDNYQPGRVKVSHACSKARKAIFLFAHATARGWRNTLEKTPESTGQFRSLELRPPVAVALPGFGLMIFR